MSEDSDFLSFMAVQLTEFQFQRFNTDIIRQLDKIRQGCSQLPIINTGLINVSTHVSKFLDHTVHLFFNE